MIYLSDFSSEGLIAASLNLFAKNLHFDQSNETHLRYVSNAKRLLQVEIYPKLAHLANILTEPIVFNTVVQANIKAMVGDIHHYRFSCNPDLIFIAMCTCSSYVFIVGEYQFDGSMKIERYETDLDYRLISVQNHLLKMFEVIENFKPVKTIDSSVGAHLFSSSLAGSQSHKHQSNYVAHPIASEVTIINGNPFKDLLK